MQTAAPHNVESDAIQLSDEYQAADVPPLFRSLFFSLLSVSPQPTTDGINLHYQLR